MADALILVNGLPAAGKTTLARRLADTISAQLLSKPSRKRWWTPSPVSLHGSRLSGAVMDLIWALAASAKGTVIVDSFWYRPRDLEFAREGVRVTGAHTTIEVWCQASEQVAQARYATRRRHRIHEDERRLADWDEWLRTASPLAIWIPTDAASSSDVVAQVAKERDDASATQSHPTPCLQVRAERVLAHFPG